MHPGITATAGAPLLPQVPRYATCTSEKCASVPGESRTRDPQAYVSLTRKLMVVGKVPVMSLPPKSRALEGVHGEDGYTIA